MQVIVFIPLKQSWNHYKRENFQYLFCVIWRTRVKQEHKESISIIKATSVELLVQT